MGIDPYVYPGTDVLRNKLGIKDARALQAVENDYTAARLVGIRSQPIPGSYDLQHLQAFHRRIFSDVYEWAGEIRTVPIAKADLFCSPEYIQTYADEVFAKLEGGWAVQGLDRGQFVDRLAEALGDVNALHPFREGNGRAQRAFFDQLSGKAGYSIEWGSADKARNDAASVAALRGDNRPLREMLDELLVCPGDRSC